jgi:flavin reductase (DIM6/NTAB) family NADH-FMN oxidoreductase RutF
MPNYHFEDWKNLDGMYRRNFFNSLTGFKSLCLIGTKNAGGKTNLAPFTQVIHIGANPPLTGVLFRPHTVQRDTLENILTTEVFTLNQVLPSFVHEAHYTSASWEESEFSATGLVEEYLFNFPAPFVEESRIKWACRLEERLDVKSNGTILIIGRIEHVIVPDEHVGQDGFIDLEAAETLTVSGLDAYHQTQKIARFSYPKPGKPPVEI